MSYLDRIDLSRLPVHIAIIMDGNGRWAKQHGKNRVFGHRSAITSVRAVTEACAELGVPYLTLYAFSKENWSRPKAEVNALMTLLVNSIRTEIETLQKNNIRLVSIGDMDTLPRKCKSELLGAIEATKHNTRLTVVLALNYGARWEILEAVHSLAREAASGKLDPLSIDEAMFASRLTTAGIPDPELMIRTSGEERISNFLLWQLAYAELIFTPTLWPDFGKENLYECIWQFQQRERRFGKISEQITV
jgi:undecaprenyl diphosphate synthase